MLTILIKILVIFAMIFVGLFANKRGILPAESNKYLVDLLILITSPAMILHAMATGTLNHDLFKDTVTVLLGALLFFTIMPVIAYFLSKLLRSTPSADIGVLMVVMIAVNTGFMGFPITKAIFGDYIFFLIVIANIPLNIYLYLIAILQMNIGRNNTYDLRQTIKSALNPCIIAALLGAVILFAGIHLPLPVIDFLGLIGDATIPLSMIIVGVQLAGSNVISILKNKDLIKASLINLIIVPMLTFLAVHWLPISSGAKLTLVFSSCFPCAVASVGVAAKEGHNADLVAEGVALTTTFSLITLPVAATILSHIYGM